MLRLTIVLLLLTISSGFIATADTIELADTKIGKLTAKVILPASYNLEKDKIYPVIYVLDGQQHGKHTATNAAFLASTDVMPEVIVVALNGLNRVRYYTASKDSNDSRKTGEAHLLLSALHDQLIPKINQQYRTSSYDMLAGHSLGGVFAAHVLQTNPEIFDAYFMFSPALWWNDEHLNKNFTRAKTSETPFVYVSLANEKGMMKSAYSNFKAVLKSNDISFMDEDFPKEDHMTTPLNSQISAFRNQFSTWLLNFDDIVSNPQIFLDHYSNLNKQYGTNAKGNESDIGQPVQHIINELKDKKKALLASDIHLSAFPNSQWAYKSKADALELNGDIESAVQHMQKAVAIAKEKNDSYLSLIEKALSELQKKAF